MRYTRKVLENLGKKLEKSFIASGDDVLMNTEQRNQLERFALSKGFIENLPPTEDTGVYIPTEEEQSFPECVYEITTNLSSYPHELVYTQIDVPTPPIKLTEVLTQTSDGGVSFKEYDPIEALRGTPAYGIHLRAIEAFEKHLKHSRSRWGRQSQKDSIKLYRVRRKNIGNV